MNSFVKGIKKSNKFSTTENGAKTRSTSGDKCLDLFAKIGALRGAQPLRLVTEFTKAFQENPDWAIRILLWARDVRGGAGERQIFRTIFQDLEVYDQELFNRVADRVPELGRFDDLLVAQTTKGKNYVLDIIRNALLVKKNGLAAKWMPRKDKKGFIPVREIREHLGLSPKQYRKLLVELTNVVETQMCAKDFESIEYGKVPSLAMARYTKAFKKNDLSGFTQYLANVASGVEKINVGAVYPYDVLKGTLSGYVYSEPDNITRQRMIQQWEALPELMGDKRILPMVDVSGSMGSICGGKLTCMEVATSLGLYIATKNKGAYKNIVVTFTDMPVIYRLDGDIVNKARQLLGRVGYNTNIELAFRKILEHALRHNVKPEEMPEYLMIFSDMEFDAFSTGETASKTLKQLYAKAGYELPTIVWWNIQARGDKNVAVKQDKLGNVLVSGFSPAVAKGILKLDVKTVTPMDAMLEVILDSRYDY